MLKHAAAIILGSIIGFLLAGAGYFLCYWLIVVSGKDEGRRAYHGDGRDR
jgi:hypothetical protein